MKLFKFLFILILFFSLFNFTSCLYDYTTNITISKLVPTYDTVTIYIEKDDDIYNYELQKKINSKFENIANSYQFRIDTDKYYIFVDKLLDSETEYEYRIRSQRYYSSDAYYTAPKKVITLKNESLVLGKTTITSHVLNEDALTLNWEAVDGASYYEIYVKVYHTSYNSYDNFDFYLHKTNIETTTYTFSIKDTHYNSFVVRARNAEGKYGKFSDCIELITEND
ncbi:MAG: fibronectin type III domain-containing protein [Treponema sp.]|nr:fibronectin type III domain-containing protein [Treponema sp.]